jgi:formate dehydrogenase subunit gamma
MGVADKPLGAIAMNATEPLRNASLQGIIAAHAGQAGALLPILHAIQDEYGYVPDEAVAPIAIALDLSRAEVHGVISFYHHFRTQPAGRHVLQICRAEACQARGADRLLAHVREALGCDLHETTKDNAFTVEPVYCLGQCACGPALTADGRVYARMNAEKFDVLTTALEEKQ